MSKDIGQIIIRIDDKPTQGTVASYNGQARPGEIIIDPTVSPPALYIGDINGNIRSDWTGGAGGNGGGITPNSNIVINNIDGNVGNIITINSNVINSNNANITNLTSNLANITTLNSNLITSNNANITNLTSNLANITTLNSNLITSNNANLVNLVSNLANITTINSNLITSNNANLVNLTSNLANITTINSNLITSNNANIANLTSNVIIANTANISNINSNVLTANTGNIVNLTSNLANINILNANTANIANITSNVITANTGNIANINSNLIIANTANISNINSNVITANTGNIANINSNLIIANTANVGNLNTTGNANIAGNINASGNVNTTANMYAAGTITSEAGFISNTLTTRTGPLTLTASGANPLTLAVGTGNVALTGASTGGTGTGVYINGVKDPVAAQDAATKNYVDSLVNGLKPKASVRVATTASLGSTAYNNGAAGIGATLTIPSTTAIDVVTLAPGDRILVKNETPTLRNGIYEYTNATTLTRTTDADTVAELPDGSFVFIEVGTTNASSGWALTSTITTLGTDPVVFQQIASGGSYTAGTGLTLTGSQFSITATGVTAGSYGNATHAPTFTVNSQGQLTLASNIAITPTSIANGTSSVTIPVASSNVITTVGGVQMISATTTGANIAGYANVAGVISTVSASPSFSTTTGALQVAGGAGIVGNAYIGGNANVTGSANIGATTVSTSTTSGALVVAGGAGIAGNLTLTGNASLKVPGGTAGQVLTTTDGLGNLSWTTVGGTGIVNGTSNVTIPVTNGNVNFGVNGVANVMNVSVTTAGAASTAAVNLIGGANLNLNSAGAVISGGITGLVWAKETFGIKSTVGGTLYTWQINAVGSIVYCTPVATENVTVNLTLLASTFNAFLGQESVTVTYLMTTGTTAYAVNAVQIDSAAQTIKWVGGVAPSGVTNSITAYTFTVIKTAANTYTVLGSWTQYA